MTFLKAHLTKKYFLKLLSTSGNIGKYFLSFILIDRYTYEKESLEASFEQGQNVAGPMTESNS